MYLRMADDRLSGGSTIALVQANHQTNIVTVCVCVFVWCDYIHSNVPDTFPKRTITYPLHSHLTWVALRAYIFHSSTWLITKLKQNPTTRSNRCNVIKLYCCVLYTSRQWYTSNKSLPSQSPEINCVFPKTRVTVVNDTQYSLSSTYRLDGGALHVRICDSGLSRDLFPDDYYCLGDNENRPIKWMALESLQKNLYTTASDVWSLGVLLWELATLAMMPFEEVDPFELAAYLSDGYRLGQPVNCPDELWVFEIFWNAAMFVNVPGTRVWPEILIKTASGMGNHCRNVMIITSCILCFVTMHKCLYLNTYNRYYDFNCKLYYSNANDLCTSRTSH